LTFEAPLSRASFNYTPNDNYIIFFSQNEKGLCSIIKTSILAPQPSKSSIIFPKMKLYHNFFSDKTQVVVLFKVTNPQNNIYAKFKTLNPQTLRLTKAQFF